jgi:hypothetical protein
VIRRYLIFLALLLLTAGLAWVAITSNDIPKPVHAEIITAYLFLVTALMVFNLMRLQQHRPGRFVVFFLAGLAVKLLAHIVFLLFLAISDSSTLFADVVYFLSLYLVYTLISVYALYRSVAE